MKYLICLIALTFTFPIFAFDEYDLPDAKNWVDTRHINRSVAHIVYNQFNSYTVQGKSGLGGSSSDTHYTTSGWTMIGEGVVYNETPSCYLILTAAHVYQPGCCVQFNYAGKRSNRLPIKVMFLDRSKDFAVLQINKSDLGDYSRPTIMFVANVTEPVKVDDEVFVYRKGSVKKLRITGLNYVPSLDNFFIRIGLNPILGESGSPVVDKTGKKLLGLVGTSNGYCISFRTIRWTLQDAIAGNKQ